MSILDVLQDVVEEITATGGNASLIIGSDPQFCKGRGCLIGKVNMVLSGVAHTDTERYQLAALLFKKFPLNSTKDLSVAQGIALWRLREHLPQMVKELGWQTTTKKISSHGSKRSSRAENSVSTGTATTKATTIPPSRKAKRRIK